METTKPRLTIHETHMDAWSTVDVNDPPPNPWTKAHWHLTSQARIILRDQAEADRLARAAGHKNWLSARIATAK
jgi:hypothetical protein